MAGIIPRTSFLEETSALFTDQKVANARSKIIELLNETVTINASEKSSALLKIQEHIISNIELLEEFIDNILFMSHDASQEVRKTIVGFIEQICKSKIDFLPRIISVLLSLLRDPSPQVIKRVIQACASIYKNTLQWLCSYSDDISEDVENAWATLCLMKAQILDMIDNDNDGIRTNAVKFLEGVVILQTYRDEDSMKRDNDLSLDDVPMTMKIARRRKLEDEAYNIFDILVKFHGAVHISSVNLITCTGSLCTIAKLRPQFMSAVVQALKRLQSNLPPTLTDSQVSSVRKNLKMQLVNIIKHPSSFELQSTIVELLKDLGCSPQEIMRYIPRIDRYERERRQKRALESSRELPLTKRSRYEDLRLTPPQEEPQMEIDYDAIEEQKVKSTKINEKFIAENLKNVDIVIQLIINSIKNLPNEPPSHFLTDYTPTIKKGIPQQISNIATLLAQQMTDNKIGPGTSAFTKELPMRPVVTDEEENLIIQSARKDVSDNVEEMLVDRIDENLEGSKSEDQAKKDEATKKLRETIDKAKGEQAVIQRMKQRVKTLKLQEVTKPLSHSLKEQFMVDAVSRILKSERQCIAGGVLAKYRRISTVIAASFSDKIRELILDFIMKDLKNHLDLAFAWIYEEYCLLQGYTRHSFVKSEHKPDHAYNSLLSQLIEGVCKITEPKEKVLLLRRVYLEAPMLTDDSITHLTKLCELVEMSHHGFELIKDLTVYRPPRKQRFLKILFSYCVHTNEALREKALENIIILYAVHKILCNKIEDFAKTWVDYLEAEIPSANIFKPEYGRSQVMETWDEDTVKICLNVLLGLMPYHEELLNYLSRVYVIANADIKRTIIRAIELPIRKMGPDSFAILNMIESCPKGVETLVTRIIHILTEKQTPTPELVARVRELHKTKVTDVRLLIPILPALTKKEILTALPKLLKLNPVIVKEVFNRILGIGTEHLKQPMPITPSEVLVALHTIDPLKCELKFVVRGTSLCLAAKHLYTQDVLAVCLQQLVEIYPIPTLLMRTVIQSLTLYPRLGQFVANLLQRLILKQVWKHKVIWDGFLKCCQRLKPQSLPVLIQLPAPQLKNALVQCPDLREPLVEHAKTITESQGIISEKIMDILTGNTTDVFITDESGGYVQLEPIKKEKEDPDYAVATSGQPLPPGEDI